MKMIVIEYATQFADLHPFLQMENIFNTEEERKGRYVWSGKWIVTEDNVSGALEDIRHKKCFVLSTKEVA